MSGDHGEDTIHIVRIIGAPRDQVFRARTEPEQIRSWWGPGDFTCPEAELDLRPGGRYRLAMQPASGDPFIVGGTYREVQSPARLVYMWRWETGPAAHGPAPYRMGWEGGLDKFEALFAGFGGDANGEPPTT